MLGVVQGTLGLIGRSANELYVAVGAAMPVSIAHSDLLWLCLVHRVRWACCIGSMYVGGYGYEWFALSGERPLELHY